MLHLILVGQIILATIVVLYSGTKSEHGKIGTRQIQHIIFVAEGEGYHCHLIIHLLSPY